MASYFLTGAKEREFRFASLTVVSCTILSFCYFVIVIWKIENEVQMYLAMGLIGFWNLPILMIGYELAVCQT